MNQFFVRSHRIRRLNSKKWASTFTSKTQKRLRNGFWSLNTKVCSIYRPHSNTIQTKKLKAATTMSVFSIPPRISAIYYPCLPLTKWTKRLMSFRKSLHLQQPTPARLWPTTIRSSFLLSLSVLQRPSENLHLSSQTELMIKLALKTTAKVSETNVCTKWPTKFQRFLQKLKRRQ